MVPLQQTDLILGTAQFGLDYGITNSSGRPSDTALDDLLNQASATIRWLDTSIKYGDALDRLGRDSAAPFAIVTKIEARDPETIADEIAQTLSKLGRSRVEVVLFHDPTIFDDQIRASELASALRSQVDLGLVGKIGASLYDAAGVTRALAAFAPDVIQLPASIADRRLLLDGTAFALERSGIAVHYRSAFLQGLLLMPSRTLPEQFRGLATLVERLDALASKLDLTRPELCLAWMLRLPAIRGVVCGISTQHELDALKRAFEAATQLDIHEDLKAIADDQHFDIAMLDPRNWHRASPK